MSRKSIIVTLWRYAARYPVLLSVAAATSTLTVIASAFVAPYIISIILEQLQNGSVTLADSLWLLILYAFVQIFGEVVGWRIVTYSIWKLEIAGERSIYAKVIDHLMSQSLAFHNNRFGGALVSQTNKLTGAFERSLDTFIFQLIPVFVTLITAAIVLSFIFWQLAIILILLSTIYAFYVVATSSYLAEKNKQEAQASTEITARLSDIVTNISAVKYDAREDNEAKRFDTSLSMWQEKSLNSMQGWLRVSTGYTSILAILNVSALFAAVVAAENNSISIATVYLATTYTFYAVRQLWEFNNIVRNTNRVFGDAYDMIDILSVEPSVVDKKYATKLVVSKGKISFNKVSFTHNDGLSEKLFKNFSLDINPGEKIGLVGRSGSGKTTFTRLLLRFMDIASGEIMIDDQSAADVTQQSLRQNIAYVPQEPILFHRTIRENIAYSKPSATQKEIENAAHLAHAAEFIDKLPKAYGTLVGERGVKLSGGQRQRIAIARAILKDAPILVLDEATSALDSESEKLIQDALWELMKGRTSIVIAHRLSTIQKMDRILVLDNGKIVEQGSHAELLAKKGNYAKLWAHQSGGFIEE